MVVHTTSKISTGISVAYMNNVYVYVLRVPMMCASACVWVWVCVCVDVWMCIIGVWMGGCPLIPTIIPNFTRPIHISSGDIFITPGS